MVECARCSSTRSSPTQDSRCPGSHSQGHTWACTRNRRTTRSRASMVTSLRLRATCCSRHPSNIASNTSPAAMASGDVDAANHSPLDLLIRFPSCLDLDAGFNHQMQSNPGMPTSEHEYGHHQLPSAEHGHSAYVQALGLITSRQEHASNRICGRRPQTPGLWDRCLRTPPLERYDQPGVAS